MTTSEVGAAAAAPTSDVHGSVDPGGAEPMGETEERDRR